MPKPKSLRTITLLLLLLMMMVMMTMTMMMMMMIPQSAPQQHTVRGVWTIVKRRPAFQMKRAVPQTAAINTVASAAWGRERRHRVETVPLVNYKYTTQTYLFR